LCDDGQGCSFFWVYGDSFVGRVKSFYTDSIFTAYPANAIDVYHSKNQNPPYCVDTKFFCEKLVTQLDFLFMIMYNLLRCNKSVENITEVFFAVFSVLNVT